MTFTAWKYRLPLAMSLKTTKSNFKDRQGMLLMLTKEGITAFGEAAPLPGFSRESLQKVENELLRYRTHLLNIIQSDEPIDRLQQFFDDSKLSPSLEFGLDSLIHDFVAKRSNQTLHQLLFDRPSIPITVNGLISLIAQKDCLPKVEKMVNNGYRTLKVKVGKNFEMELKHLKTIRKQFPSLTIRIDANQAWTFDEARSNLNSLGSLDIEYCEEPLREPAIEYYKILAEQTDVPLAIDEAIHQIKNWRALLPYVSILILKPMLTGSFAKNFATIDLADTHNITTIVTTSLESIIGRLVTATLASGRGSSEKAHGLATGSFLKKDFKNEKMYLANGSFSLTDEPGIGSVKGTDIQKSGTKLF